MIGYSWPKTVWTTRESGLPRDRCTYSQDGAGCGVSVVTIICELGYGLNSQGIMAQYLAGAKVLSKPSGLTLQLMQPP
jgi:hypothetical protein